MPQLVTDVQKSYTVKKSVKDLFKVGFYFKRALAAIHLRGTTIISGGHLQWSSIFNGTVSFKQVLAVIPFLIGLS